MSVVQVKMLIEGLRKFAQLPQNVSNHETQTEEEKEVVEGVESTRASNIASISTIAANITHIARLRKFISEVDASSVAEAVVSANL